MINFNLLLSMAVVVVAHHNVGSVPADRVAVDLAPTNLDRSIHPSIDSNRMLRGSRDAADEERAPQWRLLWLLGRSASIPDEELGEYLAYKWKKGYGRLNDGSDPHFIFKLLKDNNVGLDRLTRVVNNENGEFKIGHLTITRDMVSGYQRYRQRLELNKLWDEKKFNSEDKQHQTMFLQEIGIGKVHPDNVQQLLKDKKVKNFDGLVKRYHELWILYNRLQEFKPTGNDLFVFMGDLNIKPEDLEAIINLNTPIYVGDTKVTSDVVQEYRKYLGNVNSS